MYDFSTTPEQITSFLTTEGLAQLYEDRETAAMEWLVFGYLNALYLTEQNSADPTAFHTHFEAAIDHSVVPTIFLARLRETLNDADRALLFETYHVGEFVTTAIRRAIADVVLEQSGLSTIEAVA